jgi:hypothetical protein
MATVTIGGTPYTTIADVADADLYLAASALYAASWAALTTDSKGQSLVGSTRRFERLNWIDDPAPITEQDVIDASIILAAQISLDASVATGEGTGSNLKGAGAGSAKVEFFRPEIGKAFTADIMALLSPFLESAKLVAEAIGGSDDSESLENYTIVHGVA